MVDPCPLCPCGLLEPRDSAVPADGAAKGALRDKPGSAPPDKPGLVPADGQAQLSIPRQAWLSAPGQARLSARHCTIPVPLCAILLIFPRAAGKH